MFSGMGKEGGAERKAYRTMRKVMSQLGQRATGPQRCVLSSREIKKVLQDQL